MSNNTNNDGENKFYTCKYDRPFKEIMSKESNKDILKLILENILHINITDIEVNNIERNTGNIHVRRKYLDVLLTTNEGKIQIEVNAFNKTYIHPRNTAFICDIYSHHTLVGEEYDEDTKIIQINLSYGITDTKKMRIYELRDEDGKKYVENLIIYDVNMEYYKKIWYSKNEEEIEKNKYMIMMDLEDKDLKEISKNDKVVTRYMEDLINLNKKPEFREYMTVEEDLRKIHNSELKEAVQEVVQEAVQEAVNEAKREARLEGEKNNSITIAKNMLIKGIDAETIVECTGLTKEELEDLA